MARRQPQDMFHSSVPPFAELGGAIGNTRRISRILPSAATPLKSPRKLLSARKETNKRLQLSSSLLSSTVSDSVSARERSEKYSALHQKSSPFIFDEQLQTLDDTGELAVGLAELWKETQSQPLAPFKSTSVRIAAELAEARQLTDGMSLPNRLRTVAAAQAFAGLLPVMGPYGNVMRSLFNDIMLSLFEGFSTDDNGCIPWEKMTPYFVKAQQCENELMNLKEVMEEQHGKQKTMEMMLHKKEANQAVMLRKMTRIFQRSLLSGIFAQWRQVVKSSLHTKKMLSGVLSRWSTTMGRKMVETFFKSWSGFVEKERRERIDTELASLRMEKEEILAEVQRLNDISVSQRRELKRASSTIKILSLQDIDEKKPLHDDKMPPAALPSPRRTVTDGVGLAIAVETLRKECLHVHNSVLEETLNKGKNCLVLLESGESLNTWAKLPVDQLLLRWINFQLQELTREGLGPPVFKPVSGFSGRTIRDGTTLISLLRRLEICLIETHPDKYADDVVPKNTWVHERDGQLVNSSALKAATTLSLSPLAAEGIVTAEHLTNGVSDMVMALLIDLFLSCPALRQSDEEDNLECAAQQMRSLVSKLGGNSTADDVASARSAFDNLRREATLRLEVEHIFDAVAARLRALQYKLLHTRLDASSQSASVRSRWRDQEEEMMLVDELRIRHLAETYEPKEMRLKRLRLRDWWFNEQEKKKEEFFEDKANQEADFVQEKMPEHLLSDSEKLPTVFKKYFPQIKRAFVHYATMHKPIENKVIVGGMSGTGIGQSPFSYQAMHPYWIESLVEFGYVGEAGWDGDGADLSNLRLPIDEFIRFLKDSRALCQSLNAQTAMEIFALSKKYTFTPSPPPGKEASIRSRSRTSTVEDGDSDKERGSSPTPAGKKKMKARGLSVAVTKSEKPAIAVFNEGLTVQEFCEALVRLSEERARILRNREERRLLRKKEMDAHLDAARMEGDEDMEGELMNIFDIKEEEHPFLEEFRLKEEILNGQTKAPSMLRNLSLLCEYMFDRVKSVGVKEPSLSLAYGNDGLSAISLKAFAFPVNLTGPDRFRLIVASPDIQAVIGSYRDILQKTFCYFKDDEVASSFVARKAMLSSPLKRDGPGRSQASTPTTAASPSIFGSRTAGSPELSRREDETATSLMEDGPSVTAEEILSALNEVTGVVSSKAFIQFLRDIQVLDGSLTQERARLLFEFLVPKPRVKKGELGEIKEKTKITSDDGEESEFVFYEFVELLIACACLKDPNPFVPLRRRIELFFKKEVIPAVNTILKDAAMPSTAARSTGRRTNRGVFSSSGNPPSPSPRGRKGSTANTLQRSRSMTLSGKTK